MTENNNSLVSVVMPALNAEDYLTESIKSILNQSYKNLELIIIDDHSSDKTWKIMKEFSKKDSRVKVLKNEKHLGVGANRNRGIEAAKGEYIAWQDADDISTIDRIQLQVEYLDKHPEVGVVGGFLEFFGKNIKNSIRRYAESDAELRKNIFRFNPVAQPVSMFRKTCFESVGLYEAMYKNASEDLDMFFRLGTKYKFANIQKVLLYYRQYPHSLTRKHLKEMEQVTIKLRFKYSKEEAYNPTIVDYLYNFAQYLSIYLIPSELKIATFNFFRNN